MNSLVKIDPFFDVWFGDSTFSPRHMLEKGGPQFKLVNKPDKYILKAEIPGYTQDDIKVEISDGVITVSGNNEAQQDKDGVFSSSISRFKHSYRVPEDIDYENITADLKSGILAINIPRKQKEIKKIEIKVTEC